MNLLRKIFFQIWYFRNPPWDTNQTPPELHQFIAENPPGRALDLGCGTGTNVITLVNNGWEAVGVDFVSKAIRSAKRKARQESIEADFQVGDVTRLKGVTGTFDLILDIGCYHSLSEAGKEKYRVNLDRLLVPGGHFLLYCFFKPEGSDATSGLIEADLDAITTYLKLITRVNSTERENRLAAWLTYRKP